MGAIRLFLALVVAANHFMNEVIWPSGGHISMRVLLGFNAGYAVMFFYVISGFLITYTLIANYDRTADGVVMFYRNRFIRIFSLYWPLLIVAAYLGARPVGFADTFTNLFIVGADWRVLFADFPREHWQALPSNLHQAWSLAPELCFYVAAPWILRSWRAAIALLIASLACRATALIVGVGFNWTYLFAPATFGFFMLGHLTARAAMRWPSLGDRRFGFAMLALCAFTIGLFPPTEAFDTPRFWFAASAFTVALPGVFAATKDSALLNAAGALSYPLYLTHELTRGITQTSLISATQRPLLSLGVFCGACLMAAITAHLLLERPFAAILRFGLGQKKRMVRSPSSSAAHQSQQDTATPRSLKSHEECTEG